MQVGRESVCNKLVRAKMQNFLKHTFNKRFQHVFIGMCKKVDYINMDWRDI